MTIPPVLLQAAAPSGSAAFLQLVPYLLIFAVFWFVLLAPMRRQQKKTQQMLSALKKGDRVVTNGGIYGTVQGIEDQIVWLRIADQVKVKVARSAITGLVSDGDKAEPEKAG